MVDLAESVAEKIARLNRRSPARDAYDLVWVAGTPGLDLDRTLTRRLAVFKTWIDLHGLHTEHASWAAPLPNARAFDVERWLSPRAAADFDDQAIGLLTVPPPDLTDLGLDLSRLYQWIADLDDDERQVAEGRTKDRDDPVDRRDGSAQRRRPRLRGKRPRRTPGTLISRARIAAAIVPLLDRSG